MKKAACLFLAGSCLVLASGSFLPALTHLTAAERANALIDFELDADQPAPVVALCREVESLWNSGAHDAALARLPELAERAGDSPPKSAWSASAAAARPVRD